jgi:2-polyprenyl-3-methyl-5-hydroxy-6-metoxy-1,4-benzoquinol methylase
MPEKIDERDLSSSASLNDIGSIEKVFGPIARANRIDKMLDIGCGYGALTQYIGEMLKASEVHGIDFNSERISIAEKRGIKTHNMDLNYQPFPFQDSSFDLVVTFGVLEHLVSYDNILRETHRILKDDGIFVVSTPNLGSYVNRFALLLGYQPRDVEVSQVLTAGVLPFHAKGGIFHIHCATLRTMKELLAYNEFRVVSTMSHIPLLEEEVTRKIYAKVAYILDHSIGRIPSISRRYIIVCKKGRERAMR